MAKEICDYLKISILIRFFLSDILSPAGGGRGWFFHSDNLIVTTYLGYFFPVIQARLCVFARPFFFKLFNQRRKARDAETQRIKNIGITGIHHSLSKTREINLYKLSIFRCYYTKNSSNLKRHKKNRHLAGFQFLSLRLIIILQVLQPLQHRSQPATPPREFRILS